MKQEWMQRIIDLGTYLYCWRPGKTYPIKETLKANGFRYSKLFGVGIVAKYCLFPHHINYIIILLMNYINGMKNTREHFLITRYMKK